VSLVRAVEVPRRPVSLLEPVIGVARYELLARGANLVRPMLAVAGDLPGFERYDDLLAATPPGRLEDEREGREMLYSSGTTGRPKGVRKELPGTAFGDPASAPVIIAKVNIPLQDDSGQASGWSMS